MNKSFLYILCAMFLFLGIVIGFLWSPAKNGVYCGNNNGSNNIENSTVEPIKLPTKYKEKAKNKC